MKRYETILNSITAITQTSNDTKIEFNEKLQRILMEIVKCMNIQRGSIMIRKGVKNLEVAASTIPDIIGIVQSIDKDSPSSWVVKNEKQLYVSDIEEKDDFRNKFKKYKKKSFLLVPIFNGEKVIGVLNVTDKIGNDSFTQQEQEVFLNFAGLVIGALENHRLTESLKKSKATLQKKNSKLKKLEKIRTELFNMLIHDLKGPISEVVANLDILTYTVHDEENLGYVEAAQTGCDTLYRMVSDLLDISRLEEGSLKLVKEKISPDDIVREAFSRLHGLSKTKEIQLVEKFDSTEDKQILSGDRGLLLRVLQNLLTNAIHHSPRGEKIEAGFNYKNKHFINFFVKDNGPGIPKEYQQTIFDKFVTIGEINDGRIYTTGLGLTFCKMAVEEHKGTIVVESEEKEGSSFIFELPLKKR